MDALAPYRVAGSTLVMVALAVCACGYQPGSFAGDATSAFAGARATVGCLDVSVAGRWSRASSTGQTATGQMATGQTVVVDFGNRCDRPVVVDFTTLRAFGRDAGGREHPLAIYDPRREIRPLSLEARSAGREVLELRRQATAGATTARVLSACVDVGRLTRDAAPAPRWLCVSRPRQDTAGEAS
jgi:hypothetical protein